MRGFALSITLGFLFAASATFAGAATIQETTQSCSMVKDGQMICYSANGEATQYSVQEVPGQNEAPYQAARIAGKSDSKATAVDTQPIPGQSGAN